MADPRLSARYRRDLQQERERLRKRLDAIEQTLRQLDVLDQTDVGVGAGQTSNKPGTTEAVKSYLRGRGPESDEQILRGLQEKGWEPKSEDPLNALRATLNRLARIGQLVKDDQTYCLPDEHPKVARLPRAQGVKS